MEPNKIINWVENKKIENAKIENQWKIIRPPVKYAITALVTCISFVFFVIFQDSLDLDSSYFNGILLIGLSGFVFVFYVLGGFSKKLTDMSRFHMFVILFLMFAGIVLMRYVVICSLFWRLVGCLIFLVSCYFFRKIKLKFVEGGEK